MRNGWYTEVRLAFLKIQNVGKFSLSIIGTESKCKEAVSFTACISAV